MTDIAHNVSIRDVDIRALAVVTLTIVVSEFWGAPEIISVLAFGMLWAFLTTPDSKEFINAMVYKFEGFVEPLTKTRLWKIYGRPVSYVLVFTIITVLAIF